MSRWDVWFVPNICCNLCQNFFLLYAPSKGPRACLPDLCCQFNVFRYILDSVRRKKCLYRFMLALKLAVNRSCPWQTDCHLRMENVTWHWHRVRLYCVNMLECYCMWIWWHLTGAYVALACGSIILHLFWSPKTGNTYN